MRALLRVFYGVLLAGLYGCAPFQATPGDVCNDPTQNYTPRLRIRLQSVWLMLMGAEQGPLERPIFGRSLAILAATTLFLVGSCDGAREVDYRPSRGISADIAATHEMGATSLRRGMTTEEEPLGAMPWQLGERHQGGP
ncbi:MAG TPA: hypothetical protein VGU20_20880 [Stellaceae bacterium]|nr:hypothetical protein [Stellaceae bacterium]